MVTKEIQDRSHWPQLLELYGGAVFWKTRGLARLWVTAAVAEVLWLQVTPCGEAMLHTRWHVPAERSKSVRPLHWDGRFIWRLNLRRFCYCTCLFFNGKTNKKRRCWDELFIASAIGQPVSHWFLCSSYFSSQRCDCGEQRGKTSDDNCELAASIRSQWQNYRCSLREQ